MLRASLETPLRRAAGGLLNNNNRGLPLGKINLSRVILGGLVAGLVLNIGEFILNTFVIGEQSAAAMTRLGLPAIGSQQIVWFVVFGFLYGIWLVWLYAAIRPRFGAGVRTAIIAGLALWVAGALSSLSTTIAGVLPTSLTVTAIVWGLFEMPIATVVGAWLYKEESAA